MSRPASVEDLITLSEAAQKPKFISKKKRANKPTAPIPAPKSVKRSPSPSSNVSSPQNPKTAKKLRLDRYVFDWDAEEDTLMGYLPLVRIDRSSTPSIIGKHWSQKPQDEMTSRDWRILRDDFNISLKGNEIENPLRRWNEAKLPRDLMAIVTKKYQEPTPIQRAAIPTALKNRDIVGVAETGSGKTLAYLLPMLAYIMSIDLDYLQKDHSLSINSNNALGLVLAPSRELALQITAEAQKFTEPLGFNVVSVIGGHQYEETVQSMSRGVHIVVATPGRLVDSLERGIVDLSKCYLLVLDEADRMIDMGFEKDLTLILRHTPSGANARDSQIFGVHHRTTLMFTATITPSIENVANTFLQDPAYVYVGGANEAVGNITQKFEFVSALTNKGELDLKRFSELVKVLSKAKGRKPFSAIVFANYRRVVEEIVDKLADSGFPNVTSVHGSKSQEARERAIDQFRSGKASVLVATDVAARGLDVPNVLMVVNFQMSNKFEEYIHRIGRTGRGGREGTAFTFLDEGDRDKFQEMRRFLNRAGIKVPEWMTTHST